MTTTVSDLYEERRKRLQAQVEACEDTLTEIHSSIQDRNGEHTYSYTYVHNVLTGVPGRTSKPVLNMIEEELERRQEED